MAAIAVMPIFFAQYADNIWVAVGIISVAVGAHQAWSTNIFTIVSDIVPLQAVSSVVGIGGMSGAIASTLFPLVVSYYKNIGNISIGYHILFIISGCAYILAWMLIQWLTKNMRPITI